MDKTQVTPTATTVVNRARWTFGELLPVVVFGGLGFLGVFLGITEQFTLSGAIITAVVGFGLTAYVIGMSSGRKRKSTLYAKFENDEDYTLSVWMKKPIKEKWNEKIDEGKNTTKLMDVTSIKMETIRSNKSASGGATRVIRLDAGKKKPMYVPIRIAQTDAVRKYIAEAIEKKGGKVAFDNTADAKEFTAILTGTEYERTAADEKDVPKVTATAKDVKPRAVAAPAEDDNDDIEANEEVIAAEDRIIDFGTVEKPHRVIGYEAYRTLTPEEKVHNAILTLDEPAKDETDEINGLSVDMLRSNRDVLGNGSNSIAIDLGTGAPITTPAPAPAEPVKEPVEEPVEAPTTGSESVSNDVIVVEEKPAAVATTAPVTPKPAQRVQPKKKNNKKKR
jgi:hypothetical protein